MGKIFMFISSTNQKHALKNKKHFSGFYVIGFFTKHPLLGCRILMEWRDAVPKVHCLQAQEQITTSSNTVATTRVHQQAACV